MSQPDLPASESHGAPESEWTVRIHTMAGDVIEVQCRNSGQTTIGDIKRGLWSLRPEFPVDRQCLMRPPQALDSEAPSDHPVLGDECTLNACGLGDGASLELLIQEIELRDCDLKLLEALQSASGRVNLSNRPLDAQSCAVIAMALGNEVRN
jgi:hypothetical protein